MSTQSYPWFKFAHVEYLLNPVITGLSLAAQGANARLMSYAARELPFATLPSDSDLLRVMAGAKSVKQWQSISNELIGKVWFVNNDGRLSCPLMNVESAPVAEQEPNQDDEQSERSSDAERARRYRENKKNRDEKNEPSRTVTDSDRDASHDRHATVTHENVTHRDDAVTHHDDDRDATVTLRDEMGGRGEDLDSELKQDLDLKQELKTTLSQSAGDDKPLRFFDDELRPDLNTLNAKLGANLIDQKFIEENLFSFNSHFETKHLTDNQRLAKWISWWRSEEAKKQTQAIKRQPKERVFGNVNDDFPIVNHRRLTPEEIAANKEKLNDLPF